MSKKQRHKQDRKFSAPTTSQAARPERREVAPRITAQPASPSQKSKTAVTWKEMAARYEHVNDELKEIGILAGSFLLVLLVLWGILG